MPRYYRKIIRITAEDSPNVRYARAEIKAGLEPSGRVIVPGVLPWTEYQKRRLVWDPIRQQIGLDAQFYEGQEVLMFPPAWLDRARRIGLMMRESKRPRVPKGVGIDPGEGVANSAWVLVDEWGVVHKESERTPDTFRIVTNTWRLAKRYNLDGNIVCIDRGGGGLQIAHTLKANGLKVRTIGFGQAVASEPKSGMRTLEDRRDIVESRYAYVNRRAQMYGELRALLDPSNEDNTFGIDPAHEDIFSQLSPIPLLYDEEGRMRMPPKYRKSASSNEKSLEEIIGASPDEADALVLAVHAMLHRGSRNKVKVGKRK